MRILTAQYQPTDASPALHAARPLTQWAQTQIDHGDRPYSLKCR